MVLSLSIIFMVLYINNLSMCGNSPYTYLDNCTYKLLVVLGATSCHVIIFMYHNYYEILSSAN